MLLYRLWPISPWRFYLTGKVSWRVAVQEDVEKISLV